MRDSYFGEPSDILERLGNELSLSSERFNEDVEIAMKMVGTMLTILSPLFEALCDYCNDPDKTDEEVVYQYHCARNKLD